MNMGAQRAEAQPQDGVGDHDNSDWAVNAPHREYVEADEWPPREQAYSTRVRLFGGAMILIGAAWLAAASWTIAGGMPEPTLPLVVDAITTICGPLVLLAIAWMVWGRTSRRETERFTNAIVEMRRESAALESILAIVATRLEENHRRLTSEAAKLMTLGDEASDRLGRVTHYIAKESAQLDSKSEQLEAAAAAARVDIGVLLHDLPRAEEQARRIAEAMKSAGLTAHQSAGALESQLSALIARGREADEVVGGAAQRLGAHLARIESTSASASNRMDEAAAGMTATIDATMAKAAEAVDAARSGLEAQGNAMLAMIEQSRSALDRAGDEAGRNLANRLDQIGAKVGELAKHLAAQDAASHTLIDGLSRDLAELDQGFAKLGESGGGSAERLGASIETVRACVRQMTDELNGGHDRAAGLIDRTREMAQALTDVTGELDAVPAALGRIEEQADKARSATTSILPKVEAIRASTDGAAAKLAATEASVARQGEALDALLGRLGEGLGGAEEKLRALGTAVADADEGARKIIADTGPELVEALVRVREAANHAATHARDAIASAIPQGAAALGEASRQAITNALATTVERQMGELGMLAERAVEAARHASERLTKQMLTIGAAAAAIEERIDDTRRERDAKDSQNLSRRVALLIESLNSTAIDVTKILSNEITDSAWSAYLKGDRGVFTRRAVRLLDSGEAREITRHYEEEPEFREQVTRYINDFESMLRRVLADPDGSALGVTLLSSDMGKLYVALAQAIERLR
jgi:hypothetical protein